jgi:hypothetical protein
MNLFRRFPARTQEKEQIIMNVLCSIVILDTILLSLLECILFAFMLAIDR